MIPARKRLFWTLWAVSLCFVAGCSRDPEARKQKYLQKANSYFQQAKYNEAIIEYENAIQIDPKFGDAHYGLAQCFLKQGDLSHAYQELTRTTEYEPTKWKAQVDLGDLLLAGRQTLQARDLAQTILKGDPQNTEAQMLLSGADAALGNLPKAIAEALQGIQMDPNRSASYLFLAELQERNKDVASAEKNYQKAQSVDPKSAPAILAYGRFCARQNRLADAQKQFRAAITLSPQDPTPYALLAQIYLAEGQKDMAEQVLRDAKTSMKDNSGGYRMLGEFYLGQGQPDKAVAEFASLHAEHPKDLAVTKTYIALLILQNHPDDASKLDDAILKDSPSDTEGLIFRGELLTRQGKAGDAVPVLESAAKNAPDNPSAHYELGVAYAAISNFGQAQSEWQRAAQLRPGMAEPQRALSAYAVRKGDTTLLSNSSEALIKIEPHSPEGYILHSRALLMKGDKTGAEADLKKAIEMAPTNPAAFARMGDLRAAAKQTDEAAKFYAQALALNPSANDALAGLVNIDLARQQPAQALKRVQDQIARVPDNSGFYLLLGQVELRNQDPAKAEQAFQKATELDKNNVSAFMFLSNAEVARGSVDQAIANYQRALQDNPRDVRLYILLGGLQESRGDWKDAEDLYQKALQTQPDYPLAANDLAYLMLEHDGNVNVALSLAQTARRGMPDVPNIADTLGWAYYHQGAYSSAIDTLQEAVNEKPDSPTFHYHLGMAYEKANNHAMAKKQLEDTLKISPDYAQANEIRKVLSE
jgi:tetratricopeptide (TPR) repeat protein